MDLKAARHRLQQVRVSTPRDPVAWREAVLAEVLLEMLTLIEKIDNRLADVLQRVEQLDAVDHQRKVGAK